MIRKVIIQIYRAIRLDKDHFKKDNENGVPVPRHLRFRRHGQDRNPGGPPASGRTTNEFIFLFLRGVSVTGNGDSLASDRACQQCIHRTAHVSHAGNFSRAWRKAQVAAICLSQKTALLARMLCFRLCLSLHLSLLLPCFILRTRHIPVHRNRDSCLAVLPNSLRSQNSSGTEDPTPTLPEYCKACHRRQPPTRWRLKMRTNGDWASCVLLCRRSCPADTHQHDHNPRPMLLFWSNCGLSATSCCGMWVPSDDGPSGSDEDEHHVWSRV